jgi:hypothetical protein
MDFSTGQAHLSCVKPLVIHHLRITQNTMAVVWGFALLASVGVLRRADASTARTLSLTEMSQSAEIIADVTVQNVRSYWAAPGEVKAIRTKVAVTVN